MDRRNIIPSAELIVYLSPHLVIPLEFVERRFLKNGKKRRIVSYVLDVY
jgi:hypothetical protein